ncbi:MAG: hypothetical protein WCF65_06105 [Parachlamydiaceae bacterium]
MLNEIPPSTPASPPESGPLPKPAPHPAHPNDITIHNLGPTIGANLPSSAHSTLTNPVNHSVSNLTHPAAAGKVAAAAALLMPAGAPKERGLKPLEPMSVAGMIAFGKAFMNSTIDRVKDDIPALHEAVRVNFIHIFPDDPEGMPDSDRKTDIALFRQEMNTRITTNTVTYEWWCYFNLRLSILATSESDRKVAWSGGYINEALTELMINGKWKNHEDIVAARNMLWRPIPLINVQSTTHCYFPTTLGELNIADMNDMFATGVFPIGLVNHPVMADGRLMHPVEFFIHDLTHSGNECARLDGLPLNKLRPFCETFQEVKHLLNKLPNTDKDQLHVEELVKLLDFIVFNETHEVPLALREIAKYPDKTDYFTTLEKKDSIFALPKPNFLERMDWYESLIPSPQFFGINNKRNLIEFGSNVLHSLLTMKSKINKNIIDTIQSFQKQFKSKSAEPSGEFLAFTVPATRYCIKDITLNITPTDLILYNNIVRYFTENGKIPEIQTPFRTPAILTILDLTGLSQFV